MNNDNNVLFSFLPCFDYAYKGFGPIINTVIQGYTVAHFYLNFLSVYIYSNSSEKNMIWKTKMNVYSSYTLQFFLIKHILRARDPLATPCLFLFSTPSRVPSSLWINLSQPFFCYVYSLSKSFLSFPPPHFSHFLISLDPTGSLFHTVFLWAAVPPPGCPIQWYCFFYG